MENLTENYITLLLKNEELIKKHLSDSLQNSKDTGFFTTNVIITLESCIPEVNSIFAKTARSNSLEQTSAIQDYHYSKGHFFKLGNIVFKKCLETGITLNMFLLFVKCCRNIYKTLFTGAGFTESNLNTVYYFTERCFDKFESAFMETWAIRMNKNRILEMQSGQGNAIRDKNRYLAIFDTIYAPIILLDDNHRILNYNAASSCLFTDLKISRSIYSKESGDSAALKPIREKLKGFITSIRHQLTFETYITTLNGEKYYKVIYKKMTDENDQFSGTMIMLEDLTHYKEVEENLQEAKAKAEEADRLKTAFLANMSHEIRTPMNAILGFTELMLHSNHSRKERNEFLQLIRKSSNDLLTIIDDIIDIAKMESKQLKIKYKICNPYETLNDLYVLFKETNQSYGLHKDVELLLKVADDEKDIMLYTDGERLKQVVSNLLNNAIKFTSKGHIEFGYNLINDTSVFFFVRDTGEGIPESMKSKIFDRFVQIERNAEKNHRGAGLGLAICKNIVNLMGGEIGVESVEGNGSDFYFILPRRDVPDEMLHEQQNNKENIQDINLKNTTILVAEDDNINFMYLNVILKNHGAKVLHAQNGLEAINIAEAEEKLDIILMDIKMPLVDGLEAAGYISRVRPEIPIIAQTAFAMNGDQKKCLDAGCCAYISKPVDQNSLIRMIHKFLTKQEKIIEVHEVSK